MAKKPLCMFCGREYEKNPKQAHHDYCSPNCRKRAWDKKKMIENRRISFNEFIDKLMKGSSFIP